MRKQDAAVLDGVALRELSGKKWNRTRKEARKGGDARDIQGLEGGEATQSVERLVAHHFSPCVGAMSNVPQKGYCQSL